MQQLMEKTTALPPLVFQEDPIDIHIRIYREGARFAADIFAIGQIQRAPIEMSPQDLVALNKQLQKLIQDISRDNVDNVGIPAVKMEEQLRLLAEAGHYAFKRVFSNRDLQTSLQKLVRLHNKVSIQIASEDFFLPWELIYPVSLEEPLSYSHFWGMKSVISRIIVQNTRPGAFVSPIISISSRPTLGLLTYERLPGVLTKEIPFFDKLEKDGKISLFKLRALNSHNKPVELKEFTSFWNTPLNVAHFACHAFYKEDMPASSHILLSDEFAITIMDMEVYDIKIAGHPLIIINACKTGNLNPLYTSYFAAVFLKYGARGVVATECSVPDSFAADFAKTLYSYLLAGQPLGLSLLASRRYFMINYSNPSGLLYSMYASPAIRFVQVGG